MKRLMSFILLLVLAISSITSVYAQRQDGIRPSFKQGYARSAGESKHPQLWKGLVGAWVPDLGVTGNTLHDVSSFKNHGTLTNMDAGTDWVVSEGKHTLDFDGTNDYVDLGAAAVFDITGNMTILARINKTGDAAGIAMAGTILGKEIVSSAGYSFELLDSDDGSNPRKLRFFKFGLTPTSHFSTATIPDNTWTDVAAVYNGAESIIYINGAEDSSPSATGSITTNNDSLKIGFSRSSGNTDNYFNGNIIYVLFYNRALTPNEIAWLHREPYAMFERRE